MDNAIWAERLSLFKLKKIKTDCKLCGCVRGLSSLPPSFLYFVGFCYSHFLSSSPIRSRKIVMLLLLHRSAIKWPIYRSFLESLSTRGWGSFAVCIVATDCWVLRRTQTRLLKYWPLTGQRKATIGLTAIAMARWRGITSYHWFEPPLKRFMSCGYSGWNMKQSNIVMVDFFRNCQTVWNIWDSQTTWTRCTVSNPYHAHLSVTEIFSLCEKVIASFRLA